MRRCQSESSDSFTYVCFFCTMIRQNHAKSNFETLPVTKIGQKEKCVNGDYEHKCIPVWLAIFNCVNVLCVRVYCYLLMQYINTYVHLLYIYTLYIWYMYTYTLLTINLTYLLRYVCIFIKNIILVCRYTCIPICRCIYYYI